MQMCNFDSENVSLWERLCQLYRKKSYVLLIIKFMLLEYHAI